MDHDRSADNCFLGNPLGRKKTILLGSSIMIIGAILQCSAFSLPQLIVGRIITGLGNGANTSTVSLLMTLGFEVASYES